MYKRQVLGDAPIVSGTATLSTVALAGGNHSLRAYYPGNATYALAGSPVVNESVTAIAGNGFAGVNGPFSVGTMPVAIAVADVNADGLADLIVANEGSNNISVLLGNRGGGFSPASGSPFAVGVPDAYGYLPDAVAVGDFNGDGKPDLAIANKANRMVWLLFGDGTGAFTPPPYPYYAGAGPDAMVAADFNGDGNTDLAVANYADGTIQVLPGNGAGGFGLPVRITFGLGIPAIAAGDFNGDGYADLAVADVTDGKVWILLGNSTGAVSYTHLPVSAGALQPNGLATVGTKPVAIAAGDLNGDGKVDLVVANGDGTISVLLGSGTGTFAPAVAYTAGVPTSLALGDFNGDGKLDVAVSNGGNSTVSILLGNGDGTFQPMGPGFPVGRNPVSLVAGDFNGDGNVDLATANFADGTGSVLLGNGDGTFGPALTLTAASGSDTIAIADFNGDGFADLAVENRSAGNLSVFLGKGDGTFQAAVQYHAILASSLTPAEAAAAALNGDLSLIHIYAGGVDLNAGGRLRRARQCPHRRYVKSRLLRYRGSSGEEEQGGTWISSITMTLRSPAACSLKWLSFRWSRATGSLSRKPISFPTAENHFGDLATLATGFAETNGL